MFLAQGLHQGGNLVEVVTGHGREQTVNENNDNITFLSVCNFMYFEICKNRSY